MGSAILHTELTKYSILRCHVVCGYDYHSFGVVQFPIMRGLLRRAAGYRGCSSSRCWLWDVRCFSLLTKWYRLCRMGITYRRGLGRFGFCFIDTHSNFYVMSYLISTIFCKISLISFFIWLSFAWYYSSYDNYNAACVLIRTPLNLIQYFNHCPFSLNSD